MSDRKEELAALADKLAIGDCVRHVFLCTGSNCCTPEDGKAAWEELKKLIKERGLSEGENACYRTRANCLRICAHGPTMVVYPEGMWYHGMTKDRIEQFVQQHLIEGKPIEEWIFARHALPSNAE